MKKLHCLLTIFIKLNKINKIKIIILELKEFNLANLQLKLSINRMCKLIN